MPLRPEDLDALPEPARSKLRRALAQIEDVKRQAPASVAPETVPRSAVSKPRNPSAQASRSLAGWPREGAAKAAPRATVPKPHQTAAEAPRSLFERLRDWLTEEEPPEPPRRYIPVESHGNVRRFAAAVTDSAPEAEPTPAPAAPPEPSPAPAPAPRSNARGARPRGRKREDDSSWMERDPWLVPVAVMGIVALVAVGAGAMRHPGTARPAASAPADVAHSQSKAALPSSSVVAATPTRQPSVPAGQPDCGSVATHMQPVPPPAGSTHPSIPGLCYTLGNGQSWVVGCATGFGATCNRTALQAVLSCVRAAGAQQRGGVTEANIVTCAETEAKAVTGGATPG